MSYWCVMWLTGWLAVVHWWPRMNELVFKSNKVWWVHYYTDTHMRVYTCIYLSFLEHVYVYIRLCQSQTSLKMYFIQFECSSVPSFFLSCLWACPYSNQEIHSALCCQCCCCSSCVCACYYYYHYLLQWVSCDILPFASAAIIIIIIMHSLMLGPSFPLLFSLWSCVVTRTHTHNSFLCSNSSSTDECCYFICRCPMYVRLHT